MRFNIQRESTFNTCLGFILTVFFVIICLGWTKVQYSSLSDTSKPLTVNQELHTTLADVFDSPEFGEAVEPIIWVSIVQKSKPSEIDGITIPEPRGISGDLTLENLPEIIFPEITYTYNIRKVSPKFKRTYKLIECINSKRKAYELFKKHYLYTTEEDEKRFGRMCLEPEKQETLLADGAEDMNQLDVKFRYCKDGEGSGGKVCFPGWKKKYELYVGVVTADAKMNFENFDNPLNEKLYIVDIQPLLNEPDNSIYKSIFSYQRLRIRNKMGLNLDEGPWNLAKAAFT